MSYIVLTEDEIYEAVAELPPGVPKVEPKKKFNESKALAAFVDFLKNKVKLADTKIDEIVRTLEKMTGKERAKILGWAAKGAFWHAVVFFLAFLPLDLIINVRTFPRWFQVIYRNKTKMAAAAGAYTGAKIGYEKAKTAMNRRLKREKRGRTQESVVDAAIDAVLGGYDPDDVVESAFVSRSKLGRSLQAHARARSKLYRKYGDWAMRKERGALEKDKKRLKKAVVLGSLRRKLHKKRMKRIVGQHQRLRAATRKAYVSLGRK